MMNLYVYNDIRKAFGPDRSFLEYELLMNNVVNKTETFNFKKYFEENGRGHRYEFERK